MNTEHLRDFSGLHRSVTDRKVAGVAGGLGRHLNIDPTLLRVAFVVLVFFGGAGLLLYVAAWLLVPEEGRSRAVIPTSPGTRNTVLIVTAAVAAFLLVGDSWGGFGFPWPLVLLTLVVVLVLLARDSASTARPPSDVTPAAEPAAPGPTTEPDRGPRLFWVTVALLAVALGTLGLFDVAGTGVPAPAYAALSLALVGVMLLVAAWFGRGGGLILLGVLAAFALLVTSLAHPMQWRENRLLTETPLTASQVRDRYFVPGGQIHLDLSEVQDPAGLDGREIALQANAGAIVVTVPDDMDVQVNGEVSVAGEIALPREVANGPHPVVEELVDGGTGVPEMTLDIQLLVGRIEVRQA